MTDYAPALASATHVVHDIHGYGVARPTNDGRVDVTFHQEHDWDEIRAIGENGGPIEYLKVSVDEESFLRNSVWHLGLDESAIKNLLDQICHSGAMYYFPNTPERAVRSDISSLYLANSEKVASFVTKSIDSAVMLSLSMVKSLPSREIRIATLKKYLAELENHTFFSSVLYPLMQEDARQELDEMLAKLTLRVSVAYGISILDAEIKVFSAVNERVNNVHTGQIKSQMLRYKSRKPDSKRGRNYHGVHPVRRGLQSEQQAS